MTVNVCAQPCTLSIRHGCTATDTHHDFHDNEAADLRRGGSRWRDRLDSRNEVLKRLAHLDPRQRLRRGGSD